MGYRAAVIGCGRVAWMLEDDPIEVKPCTHVGAYLALDKSYGLELVAASDTDAERLELFKGKFGIDGVYADYKEMLAEVSPDIVSICAYATERHEMVMASIEAGVKGIWCEKAMATTMAEARSIVEASGKFGVSIIVSHMRRWGPRYKVVKEIIDSGGIGELKSIVSHFSGSLMHTGTHAFDILLWLAGPARWVTGSLEGGEGADDSFVWDGSGDPGGNAVIGFDNDVYATVHAESKRYFFFEFDIIGSTGRVRIGNNDVLEYYTKGKSKYYAGIEELWLRDFPEFADDSNSWVEALKNLIDCMEGASEPLSGPEDGSAAMELGLAIHESAASGGGKVNIPLQAEGLKVLSR